MSTISIDLESLGLTLTKGVTYRIELDEGFVKSTEGGIANAENTLVSFVAKGPEITSTVLDNDDFHVTSTWNVKLSALGTGNESDEYFAADYIASNYFSDLVPVATLYQDDSTFVKQYPVSKINDTQTRITIPSIDLKAGESYFLYYEEDTVIDTTQIGNDTVNTDTNTTFITQTEEEGFPSLSSDLSSNINIVCQGNAIYDPSNTLSSTADISADGGGAVLGSATLTSNISLDCQNIRKKLGNVGLSSSTFVPNVDYLRLRTFQGFTPTTLPVETEIDCFAYWTPVDTFATIVAVGGTEYSFNISGYGVTTIDWGDGTSSSGTSVNAHTYSSSGTYTIRISGDAQYLDFDHYGSVFDLRSIYIGKNVKGVECVGSNFTYAGDVLGANVITMSNMFSGCSSFNQDIGHWDTSNVTNLNRTFYYASSFNQDISSWNTSAVNTLRETFLSASSFNQDISSWNTSSVTDMSGTFASSSFTYNIASWDTSSVTEMTNMFAGTSFNQDISSWDTSSVTEMSGMFANSIFDQPIGSWDTSSVTEMDHMFQNSRFNQDISAWDTSSVTDMDYMFFTSVLNTPYFDQDISSWCVSQISSKPTGFDTGTLASWTTSEKPNWGAAC